MKENIIIDPRLSKAARSLLNWSQEDLANKILATKKTITDFEKENRIPQRRTLESIKKAFEEAGIEFETGERGFGIRLITKK